MIAREFEVNGARRAVQASPMARLIDVLRGDFGLTAVRDNGVPGAGVVLVDGRPTDSALVLAAPLHNSRIETVEGLIADDPVGRMLWREIISAGVGCDHCRAGLIATATALLRITTWIDADDARAAIIGHQCRCSAYESWSAAIVAASVALREGDDAPAATWPAEDAPANLLHARLVGADYPDLPGGARVLTAADLALPAGVAAVVLTEGRAVPAGAITPALHDSDAQAEEPGLLAAPRHLQVALDLSITCMPDDEHPYARRGDAAPELDALCAALARHEGRPVRLELDMTQTLALCPPEPARHLMVDAAGVVTATPGPASIVDATIAREIAFDAWAAERGDDATALRLSMLPQHGAAVLEAVGAAASARPVDDDGRLQQASAAVLAGPIDGVSVAALAEVIIDRDTGHVGLARIALAMPKGMNRVLVTAALERGLGRALYEDPGADPTALRLPGAFALPPVDWISLPPEADLTAETAATLAEAACAAATLCAVGRAAGIRPKHVPMTNDRLLAAILDTAAN